MEWCICCRRVTGAFTWLVFARLWLWQRYVVILKEKYRSGCDLENCMYKTIHNNTTYIHDRVMQCVCDNLFQSLKHLVRQSASQSASEPVSQLVGWLIKQLNHHHLVHHHHHHHRHDHNHYHRDQEAEIE